MEPAPVALNLDEIKALLPHRPPFLMIERVIELIPDVRGTGIKTVTAAEPCFQGQPRERMIFPTALIIEAMAQSAAIGALYPLGPAAADKIPFFTNIQGFELLRPVRPGDRLELHVVKDRSFGPSSRVSCEARVAGELVARAKLTAAVLSKDAVNF
ncbi:MAG TPA: 3-hydroxyacyl-ACP dehydratase FabZ [Alphaproteobacteria bacterium]|nr:3-hydroxyacyl-ACP dehydratase FabZ [Alphaproteobacteria bacterium]